MLDAIDAEAIREAAGNRVEAYPPGYGALTRRWLAPGKRRAFVFTGPDLGQFAAISASILVEDENEDVLAHLLDGVSEDIGPPLSDGGEVVLALWSGCFRHMARAPKACATAYLMCSIRFLW